MEKNKFRKVSGSAILLEIILVIAIVVLVGILVTRNNENKVYEQEKSLQALYHNIGTLQELVSSQMRVNIISAERNGYDIKGADKDKGFKWVGIVDGYKFRANGILEERRIAFVPPLNGPTEKIAIISRNILDKTTMAESEKSKYYIGESGKVYYIGFEIGGKTYYNADTVVDGTRKPIIL